MVFIIHLIYLYYLKEITIYINNNTPIFYKFDNLIKGNKQIYLITEIVNYLLIVVNFFLSSYIKQEKNNCLLAFRK